MWARSLLSLYLTSAALAVSNYTMANVTSFSNITDAYHYTNTNTSNDFQYLGVALGGWLVLEPYITPSLFLEFNATSHNSSDIPNDEYHYCEYLGKEEAFERLSNHWDTFYNETDFKDIKEYGFNMVRIPIGYWAFDTLPLDPYVLGAQDYLDRAIEWAHKYDLKVWIDLHGAPGSQNGFDNSGLFLKNIPSWQDKEENVMLTLRVLQQIYTKYGSLEFSQKYGDTILAIEVLNEPLGPSLDMKQLKTFYVDSYLDARTYQGTNNTIVFHDAFQAAGYWDGFLNSSGSQPGRLQNYNILIDHHHYEVFSSGQLGLSIANRITAIKNYASGLGDEKSHPSVVGEWSAALTDCTPWLNSVHYGTRWEGTSPFRNDKINDKAIGTCADINNWSKWLNQHKIQTRKFIEIQLDQFESNTKGWIFWCYKTETTIEWDFKRLAEFEMFPQPFSDRKYIKNGTDTAPHASGAGRAVLSAAMMAAMAVALVF